GRATNDSGQSDLAVGRYNLSDLSFDTTFNSGPVVVDLTPADSMGSNLFDDAFGVFALPDGRILAGGAHNNPNESNSPAAIRLLGRSIENGDNPPDVVTNVENPGLTYGDVQNMTFPNLSRDAVFYIKSQPNPLGQVTLNLGDGNDVVNFYMTQDAN